MDFFTRLSRAAYNAGMRHGVSAVLFDLGNTLAAYYGRGEFQPILQQALRNVIDELQCHDAACVDFEVALARSQLENREAGDYRVRPLAERLVRIFELDSNAESTMIDVLVERFLEPIFAVGSVYDDSREALDRLRDAGYRVGIVSNAPWGSPSELWRRESARLRLLDAVDLVVFCGDVGWRKPGAPFSTMRHGNWVCRPNSASLWGTISNGTWLAGAMRECGQSWWTEGINTGTTRANASVT